MTDERDDGPSGWAAQPGEQWPAHPSSPQGQPPVPARETPSAPERRSGWMPARRPTGPAAPGTNRGSEIVYGPIGPERRRPGLPPWLVIVIVVVVVLVAVLVTRSCAGSDSEAVSTVSPTVTIVQTLPAAIPPATAPGPGPSTPETGPSPGASATSSTTSGRANTYPVHYSNRTLLLPNGSQVDIDEPRVYVAGDNSRGKADFSYGCCHFFGFGSSYAGTSQGITAASSPQDCLDGVQFAPLAGSVAAVDGLVWCLITPASAQNPTSRIALIQVDLAANPMPVTVTTWDVIQ